MRRSEHARLRIGGRDREMTLQNSSVVRFCVRMRSAICCMRGVKVVSPREGNVSRDPDICSQSKSVSIPSPDAGQCVGRCKSRGTPRAWLQKGIPGQLERWSGVATALAHRPRWCSRWRQRAARGASLAPGLQAASWGAPASLYPRGGSGKWLCTSNPLQSRLRHPLPLPSINVRCNADATAPLRKSINDPTPSPNPSKRPLSDRPAEPDLLEATLFVENPVC